GGILVDGVFTLTDCLIEDNQASAGGGIFFDEGTGSLSGSTQVTDNTASALGGGIYAAGGTLTIAETCPVTNNTAPDGGLGPPGGGIANGAGTTVTLLGASPSPIVVNNCIDNCGGAISVSKCATEPTSC